MTSGKENLVAVLNPQSADRAADVTGADRADGDLVVAAGLRSRICGPLSRAENQGAAHSKHCAAVADDGIMHCHENSSSSGTKLRNGLMGLRYSIARCMVGMRVRQMMRNARVQRVAKATKTTHTLAICSHRRDAVLDGLSASTQN